ncbi:ceramidase [Rhodovulum imhoffii]|uniref:Ceramidase n=1 Tax=Rhodovulum imhoffii TaxID=365340 RepID=A0A2T5BW22_9RHOB|nr:ceramidase domain-containing protein [Rhodovulum imhoffii]MBK5935190.1 hypothetical protein [Rhodovulum imhoffii]PTN03842.1 ceramidase [Rhodovulum imhoffii]
MDWSAQVDAYCERTGPAFWAEPVNAVTNAAFLVAALIMWRRAGGDLPGRALAVALGMIGVGSFLFHTLATVWAGVADVVPILAFILLYIYAANRRFWGLGRGRAVLGMAAFLPFLALVSPVFRALGLGASASYAPVAVLILAYALALRHRAPQVARGLAVGAGILGLSLTFRTLDAPLCAGWPLGTHFLWHLLNALMLGWMTEVYLRANRA